MNNLFLDKSILMEQDDGNLYFAPPNKTIPLFGFSKKESSMSELKQNYCPECQTEVESLEPVHRRDFIRTVAGGAATLAAVSGAAGTAAVANASFPPPAATNNARPAEAMIRELYSGLSAQQRQQVVYPWDHRQGNNMPTRLRMYNAAIFPNARIGQAYTPAQRDLVNQILRAISSGEQGYQQLTRDGTFDNSGSLQNCGAYIFGNPTQGQFSWVFTGHHLTVRCDGNSEPGAAFGGPMYYGHSPNGYSARNCFYFQTQSVRRIFDSLSAQQRQQAVLQGSPGELMPSITFRPAGQARPGIPISDMTADQRQLVEQVMRDILSPYRQEDADEVMEIIRRNGGLNQINLAFYREQGSNDPARWHFWRLEGPGFVWNYRILPHVHCYVNIANQA